MFLFEISFLSFVDESKLSDERLVSPKLEHSKSIYLLVFRHFKLKMELYLCQAMSYHFFISFLRSTVTILSSHT